MSRRAGGWVGAAAAAGAPPPFGWLGAEALAADGPRRPARYAQEQTPQQQAGARTA